MSATIGIDLGTSHAAVAVAEDGRARVLPTARGSLTEPSWVTMSRDGPVAGEDAPALARLAPEAALFGSLRLVGRKLCSPEIAWLGACSPFPLVARPNGDAAIHVIGRDYPVSEILSYLLEHLRRRAAAALGTTVETAAIAVPPTFDVLQRQAVIDAAQLAGFAEVTLVNAASAALVNWSVKARDPKRVAVVSLGAGSFDVSLADVAPGNVTILATAGDPMLGGDDFDRRVVLHLIQHHERQRGFDASGDPAALQALFELARTMRHQLTEKTRTEPVRMRLGASGELSYPGLSRRQLVELIAEELAGLKEPCRWAFEDAGLGTDDVDPVLALGGAARMPAVQSVIKYLFRNPPIRLPDDEIAVALGAAQIAAARFGDGSPIALSDVSVHAVGIKVRGGRLLTVLPRGEALPIDQQRSFEATSHQVSFELYQGEMDTATENTYLGRLSLDELEGPFAVRFTLDESGIVTVAQIDPATGGVRPTQLALAGGLTADDLVRLAEERAARSLPSNLPPDTPMPRPAPRARPDTLGQTARRRGSRRASHASGEAPPKTARPDTLAPPPSSDPAGDPLSFDAIHVEADSLVGTVLGDRYRIDEIIGEGGMGRVYRAEHRLLKKRFAIKVLHPELAVNRELAERFVREAQAASSIDSDHVVAISDFGLLDDGTGYFVMEYLDGVTLEQLIDDEGPRSAAFAVSAGRQIADALRGAHDRQIVHRDLKPSNILIQDREGRPFCKIFDFGIAKSPTSDSSSSGTTIVTMVGVMMGTPHYMAPEQIDGEVDTRSDIYALGIVLYETLTGRPPFDAESVAELLGLHKWSDPPAIHAVYPAADCPPALEAVVRRCLAKDPNERFQSAREVAVALAACEA